MSTKEEVRQTHLEWCMKRLDGASFVKIGKDSGVSRQCVASFFSRLTDNHVHGNCPFPAFRRWFNRTSFSIEELAEMTTLDAVYLESALFPETDGPLPDDIADAVAEISGVPAAELKKNVRDRKNRPPKQQSPRKGSLDNIRYPRLRELMQERGCTIKALADHSGVPYHRLRNMLTSASESPCPEADTMRIIAETLEEDASALFALR